MTQTPIERFKATARLETLDKLIAYMKTIPTGFFARLSPQTIELLQIVRKIERLVMVTYANEVQRMASWNIPSIRAFSKDWEFEETRHAIAFEEYARIHGHIMPELDAKSLGWKYRLKAYAIAKLSHLFPTTSPAVHMIAGTINEITAKNIYRLFGQRTETDNLLKEILKAIEIEEARHFIFYLGMAKELMKTEKQKARVAKVINFLWEPVGAGNDDVGIMARVLLKKDEIASQFFTDMKKHLITLKDLVPNVTDRVISDIEQLRIA